MKMGQRMTSQWLNKTRPTWKCRFSAKYRPKLIFFFAKKVPNMEISPSFFFLLTNWNGVSNSSVSFRSISWRYIFQNGDLNFFQMTTPPVPSDFDGLPYPRVRGHPVFLFSFFFFFFLVFVFVFVFVFYLFIFIIKITTKDVKEIT